ncbi:hypothetical protein HDE_12685 [Halotydeus destructor]|nr:hypothetical protein HDE_12685 [Halotydeus destructor]
MLFEFKFTELSKECLTYILFYLPIKDRIKFEQVSKQWCDPLNKVWEHQQVIAFELQQSSNRRTCKVCKLLFCGDRRHRTTKFDTITFSKRSRLIWVQLENKRLEVLRRCPNLKVLVWKGPVSWKLANCLSTFNTRIEHLEGVSELFSKLCPKTFQNIKCLEVEGDNHLQEALKFQKINGSDQLIKFKCHYIALSFYYEQ